jgi:hypothetical protein
LSYIGSERSKRKKQRKQKKNKTIYKEGSPSPAS